MRDEQIIYRIGHIGETMNIQEGDEVGYSEHYFFSVELYTGITASSRIKKRRGITGKSKTYPTKVMYREVLWEDTNHIEEVNETWLQKMN